MSSETILAAQQRLARLVRQRPAVAQIQDVPATALWEGAGRTRTLHPDGNAVYTDLPRELGGDGERVSPGWLLRAALASCAVTRIAMLAAEHGMQPERLEVEVTSDTDLHGLLGLAREDGLRAVTGPLEIHLRVRISVPGASDADVRKLVEQGIHLSPMVGALAEAVPVRLDIDNGTG
ncbi:OsmC family protein [Pseudomonas nitroreducens]|uniref:OsmC family protein n=1 Tax=Pseudomonas nitroreducens TaxID=46680 RepID=UPI002F3575B3